jgi:hypothetical protein
MEASIISALAALTGTAIGGLTTVAANWLNQRNQLRAQWLQHEKNRRQILYRDFIAEASKSYIDALQHNEADISTLVGLYAKLGRMRVLSSKPVVHHAEDIARKILDTYLEPPHRGLICSRHSCFKSLLLACRAPMASPPAFSRSRSRPPAGPVRHDLTNESHSAARPASNGDPSKISSAARM